MTKEVRAGRMVAWSALLTAFCSAGATFLFTLGEWWWILGIVWTGLAGAWLYLVYIQGKLAYLRGEVNEMQRYGVGVVWPYWTDD